MSLVAVPGWRHFAWIVVLASVVRGVVLFGTVDSLTDDPDAYRRIASCLKVHGVFGLESVDAKSGTASGSPTAFRPPLYPWLISWISDAQGNASNQRIMIFHWLLGVSTSVGTYCIAKKMLSYPVEARMANDTAALFAGCLVAVDPLLLRASSLVMTETMAAFLVVLTLWLWGHLYETLQTQGNPSRWLGLACLTGFVCGLAYLCRPTFVLWSLAIGSYIMVHGVMNRTAREVTAGGIILSILAVFVGVWANRNDRVFDKPIWATTHGGYTLLLGNNPSFYEYLREGDSIRNAWIADFFIDRWERRFDADPRNPDFWNPGLGTDSVNRFEPPKGEVADDRLAYQTAVATIERDPFGFLMACTWRLWRLHTPLPLQSGAQSNTAIYAIAAFYSVTWMMTFVGMFQLKRRLLSPEWVVGVALWMGLVAVHSFYWTDMRMRAPLVPFLAILASAPVATLLLRYGKSARSDRQLPP